MTKLSKLVAYRYDPDDFEYVPLLDVLAAYSSKSAPRHVVEIHIGSTGPYLAQSDKKLTGVLPGDWIRWQCSRPFKLTFHGGKGPEGPGTPTAFASTPSGAMHGLALPIAKLASPRLDYDIHVHVQDTDRRWQKADPSIIIETTLARVFVCKLKDGIAFPPLRVTGQRGKPPARKAASRTAATASAAPKAKARRKK